MWSRAVTGPAGRRAVGLWAGAGIAGGVIFGPTGMHPHDLTQLALGDPGVGAVLIAMWLLMFAPIARIVIHADAARWLRSLPAPRWLPVALAAAALVWLQLPWLALWLFGEGFRGLGVIGATSVAIVPIAWWVPRPRRRNVPTWRGAGRALAAIHLRALLRRQADALVRAAGLAVLAGAAAGLLVRNNALTGRDAAVLGTSVIAIMLIPAIAGAMLVLADSHRATGWLADSLGVSRVARIGALVVATTVVEVAATLLAVAAETVIAGAEPVLAATAIVVGASLGAAMPRVLSRATTSVQVVVGIVVATAIAVVWLGWLGVAGAAAAAATAVFAVLG